MLLSSRRAANNKNAVYIAGNQAFPQNALTDHARCAEENYFHLMAAFPLSFSCRLKYTYYLHGR